MGAGVDDLYFLITLSASPSGPFGICWDRTGLAQYTVSLGSGNGAFLCPDSVPGDLAGWVQGSSDKVSHWCIFQH